MFVIPSLYEPATVLRILFVFAGGLFGPFGILALLFIMLTSICGMNSFGLPYTAPLIPWGSGAVRDGVLRTNWKQLARHPFSVNDLPEEMLMAQNKQSAIAPVQLATVMGAALLAVCFCSPLGAVLRS